MSSFWDIFKRRIPEGPDRPIRSTEFIGPYSNEHQAQLMETKSVATSLTFEDKFQDILHDYLSDADIDEHMLYTQMVKLFTVEKVICLNG